MNSIPDTGNATLYNLDCTYLTDIRYNRNSLDTITLIFPEKPSADFPERFFFMQKKNLLFLVLQLKMEE